MKPPTVDELQRIRERFDLARIASGHELSCPMGPDTNYEIGGDYVKVEEMIRRLVRRCLELEWYLTG
jgi:hypothetical protein